MFSLARRHERALLSTKWRPVACMSATWATTTEVMLRPRTVATTRSSRPGHLKVSTLLKMEHPAAVQLLNTGLWESTRRGRKSTAEKPVGRPKKNTPSLPNKTSSRKREAPPGDKTRINIVSPGLVEDIISYLKPTLGRHEGCDLISLYPGVGLWDKALHEAVKPRSHLLLEPDEELYRPFLGPLCKKKGVILIPKQGLVWEELDKILTPEYVPNQVEVSQSPDEPPPRNDTLLVSINLSMYPKRRYLGFDSISRLVMYQLFQSLRTSSLFQKYGQVRMLVWIPDDEKATVLPRTMVQRARLAFTAEASTEYIAEVCGVDSFQGLDSDVKEKGGKKPPMRYGQLDLESARQALLRMRKAGIKTPDGRETHLLKRFEEFGLPLNKPIRLAKRIDVQGRAYDREYEHLIEKQNGGNVKADSAEETRLKRLYHRHLRQDKEEKVIYDWMRRYNKAMQLYVDAGKAIAEETRQKRLESAKQIEQELVEELEAMTYQMRNYVLGARDQQHILQQPASLGPVLAWDRRPYEPLTVEATDFFPNMPCTLLDIQPKAPPALLRAAGPGSSNSGDIFDLIMGTLLWSRRTQVLKQLDIIYPGTRDGIADRLTSLKDPAQGGIPLASDELGLSVSTMNQVQQLQLLDEFMRWPFRPSFETLVGRLADERTSGDHISAGGAGDDEGALSSVMSNAGYDPF